MENRTFSWKIPAWFQGRDGGGGTIADYHHHSSSVYRARCFTPELLQVISRV